METEMEEAVSQNDNPTPQMLIAAREAGNLHATRLVNGEVWKTRAFTTSNGAVIGWYTRKRGEPRKRAGMRQG